jgi:phosphoglycerate-specific signal transduction histidine kinase
VALILCRLFVTAYLASDKVFILLNIGLSLINNLYERLKNDLQVESTIEIKGIVIIKAS